MLARADDPSMLPVGGRRKSNTSDAPLKMPSCADLPVPLSLALIRCRISLQNPRLPNHARKVRDRLFVDNRWLSFARLPDLRLVVAGQDREEAGRHALIKAQ